MARRKLEDKNIRKISKAGRGSYYVTLPIDAVREFKWKEKQKVVIEIDKKRKRIIIKDWEK